MKSFTKRHAPPIHWSKAAKAGLGGCIAIAVLGLMTKFTAQPFLMAPFGASCVLLFAAPQSPLSQPAHVIGGHLVTAFIGLLLHAILPNEWWAVALATGLAIAAMSYFRVTHPPAGANPLVVFAGNAGWGFLFVPALLGAVVLVAVAVLLHLPRKTQSYPS